MSPDCGHLRAAAVGDTAWPATPTPVSSPLRLRRGPGPACRGRVGVGQRLRGPQYVRIKIKIFPVTISKICLSLGSYIESGSDKV